MTSTPPREQSLHTPPAQEAHMNPGGSRDPGQDMRRANVCRECGGMCPRDGCASFAAILREARACRARQDEQADMLRREGSWAVLTRLRVEIRVDQFPGHTHALALIDRYLAEAGEAPRDPDR